jgi:hypothetical protein
MVLFDASKFRGTSAQANNIDAANEGIGRLREHLADEIHTHVIPDWFVRSQTKVFFQGHIRRALMLIDGGYEAYLSGKDLVSIICVRSIYETVACVFDFCDRLYAHLDEGDFEATGGFIHMRLMATRSKELLEDVENDGLDYSAPNILGQIDRFSKHVGGARQDYDHLSEMVHPNSLGAALYFSEEEQIDEDRGVVKFAGVPNTHDAGRWLVKAGLLLSLMEVAISLTERRLAEHTFLSPKKNIHSPT